MFGIQEVFRPDVGLFRHMCNNRLYFGRLRTSCLVSPSHGFLLKEVRHLLENLGVVVGKVFRASGRRTKGANMPSSGKKHGIELFV
jgi:hypothetical protein